MVDFVRAHADAFNPRWTLKRARAEEEKWHAELAVTRVAERTGVSPDTVIDYAPLPQIWEHDTLSFVALQTGKLLQAEGAAMHHCVATYWQNVVDGESRIYSILENGSRVATLEIISRVINYKGRPRVYKVGQLVGPRNSRTRSDVSRAVGAFVAEVNERSRDFPSS